jgi:hypothetical protein
VGPVSVPPREVGSSARTVWGPAWMVVANPLGAEARTVTG